MLLKILIVFFVGLHCTLLALSEQKKKESCHVGRSKANSSRIQFWCGSIPPPSVDVTNTSSIQPYATVTRYKDGSIEIRKKAIEITANEIAPGGLKDFNTHKNLSLRFVIEHLNSAAFEGLDELTVLRVHTRHIDKCTFGKIGAKLKDLTIEGFMGKISINKDAFNGLSLLSTLKIHNIPLITSVISSDEKPACDHYLCALHNLKHLKISVSYSMSQGCHFKFRGLPEGTLIEPYLQTDPDRNLTCSVTTHKCLPTYDRCGTAQVCQLSSWSPWYIWLIVVLIVLILSAGIGVGIYAWRQSHPPLGSTPLTPVA